MTEEGGIQPEPAGPPPAAPVFVPQGGQLQPGQYPYYAYPPAQPTNNLAVASIITTCCSLGLLLVSLGLFAPVTAVASGIGMYLGHRGKVAVDVGEAVQQRDLAIAGFWVGVAGLILSILAIVAWIVLIAVLASLDWNEFSTAP